MSPGIIVAQSGPYSITSWGRGASYALRYAPEHKPPRSVFFQGDDADTFRGDWEALEAASPHTPALATLWDWYSDVSQEETPV